MPTDILPEAMGRYIRFRSRSISQLRKNRGCLSSGPPHRRVPIFANPRNAIASPVPMRLFCDQCGEEFDEHTLRADSKFCSYCGKALSDYIKQQSSYLFQSSPKGTRSFSLESSDPGKKRKADDDEGEPKNEPGGPTRDPADDQEGSEEITVLNQTTTHENPENGEPEEPVSLFPFRIWI